MNQDNWYDVLEVQRSANAATIKLAYRRLAMRHHPDRHAPEDQARAQVRFQSVRQAYEVLSDAAQRSTYDRLLDREQTEKAEKIRAADRPKPARSTSAPVQPRPTSARPDPIRPWPRAAAQGHGDDIEMTITLPLEQVFSGAHRQVRVNVATTCLRCQGASLGCSTCWGTGQVFADKILDVAVPAKAYDGMRLRLKKAGHDGPRFQEAGSLYLTVLLERSSRWRFDADGHVERDVPLRAHQMRDGVVVKITSLDGHENMVTVPPNAFSGQRITVVERGLPRSDGTLGDLRLVVQEHNPDIAESTDRPGFWSKVSSTWRARSS